MCNLDREWIDLSDDGALFLFMIHGRHYHIVSALIALFCSIFQLLYTNSMGFLEIKHFSPIFVERKLVIIFELLLNQCCRFE